MYQLKFISDADHGWLEVPEAAVKAAGIYDQISEFSYVNTAKNLIYLEEDVDMWLFLRAVGEENIKTKKVRGGFVRRLARVGE